MMLAEAEELYREMENPDECTYALLMDNCFKENRPDDGAAYYKKMVESNLSSNLAVYNRLVSELVKIGKVDEAKSFYDMLVKKLMFDEASYQFMIKSLSDEGRLDVVLTMVDEIIDDESAEFSEETREFVNGELKEGREEDLVKLMEEKERQKAEAKAKEVAAAESAKNSPRAAVSSLLPSKLFGDKEAEKDSVETLEDAVEIAAESEETRV